MKRALITVFIMLLFSSLVVATPNAKLVAIDTETPIELFPIENTTSQEGGSEVTTHTFFVAVGDVALQYAATSLQELYVSQIVLAYEDTRKEYTVERSFAPGEDILQEIGPLPVAKRVEMSIVYEVIPAFESAVAAAPVEDFADADSSAESLPTAQRNAVLAEETSEDAALGKSEQKTTALKTEQRKKPSWIIWIIMLVLITGLISWPAFRKLKRKNVMLVSFQEAEEKKFAQVLANKSCNKILEVLSEGEMTESQIAKKLDMSISRVHYNLKQLLTAKLIQSDGYIYSEKGSKMKLYSLTNKYVVIGPPEKKTE